MYVTTFYSFKGGVGRSMALVNAAATLALRGRRVLAVDFDIEAPGLDTFDVLRTDQEVPGLVDFVGHYLESGEAPDAAGYIGECPGIGNEGGGLWIMPSGKSNSCATNFNQVDWIDLYDRHDGYLLFEDLKEQWNRIIGPDYVLIDSRTGHTDTCGICTRQLADSVVVFFFPNEQNLRGLVDVVADIRSEADKPRSKTIELHFVMSNVPDLDDEDRILERKISSFQDQLGFRREPMVVHRYDSLSLLNQVVFAKDRPKSRLAREYREIVREISTRNWRDREGALEFIRRASRGWRRGSDDSATEREKMLERIETEHADDGEVLFRLAVLRDDERQPESAALLVQQAIATGYAQPEVYLKRARIRADREDWTGAAEDAWRVLDAGQVAVPMIREALGRIVQTKSSTPKGLVASAAVRALEVDDKFWLAKSFIRSYEHLPIAAALCEQILGTGHATAEQCGYAQQLLGMSYMGTGRFPEAARMFRSEGQCLDDMNIVDAFNYGMAIWGVNGSVDTEPFRRVVRIDRSDDQKAETTSYLQCMAIAYWATGHGAAGLEYIDRAQANLRALRGRTEYSCWRYLQVGARIFGEDLEEIRALVKDGRTPLPRFMVPVASPQA